MSPRKKTKTNATLFSDWGAAAGSSGFTLLEVMIAVAVIAIALVTLIGAQSRSVSLATDAKFDLVAALLAQQKLAELAVQEYDRLDDAEGDFGRDNPDFLWKIEVKDLGEADLGLEGIGNMIKRVDLSVSARQDTRLTFTVRTLVSKKPEAATDPGASGKTENDKNQGETKNQGAPTSPQGKKP